MDFIISKPPQNHQDIFLLWWFGSGFDFL